MIIPPVQVKICGMRDPQGFETVLDWYPDALGFVFAPSKRRVSVDQPAAWRQLIDQHVKRGAYELLKMSPPALTGVFVRPEPSETALIIEQGSLDVVQLHGPETEERIIAIRSACEERCERKVAVWKAISLPQQGEAPLDQIADEINRFAAYVDLFLLDTHDPTYVGGSGKTFNWRIITSVLEISHQAGKPLWVAGGLHPDNVDELLNDYDVDGVDVSSGVETGSLKDLHKIEMFIKRVKTHGKMA